MRFFTGELACEQFVQVFSVFRDYRARALDVRHKFTGVLLQKCFFFSEICIVVSFPPRPEGGAVCGVFAFVIASRWRFLPIRTHCGWFLRKEHTMSRRLAQFASTGE